jgi:hypothetical protein
MFTASSPATSTRPRRARRHPLRALAVASVAFGSIAGLGAMSVGPASSASAFKRYPRPPVTRPVLVPPAHLTVIPA